MSLSSYWEGCGHTINDVGGKENERKEEAWKVMSFRRAKLDDDYVQK